MQTPNDRILIPFHQELLKRFAASPMGRHFFLTGGTALAAFYLHHRLSEDLDLFTEAPDTVPLVLPVVQKMAKDLKISLHVWLALAMQRVERVQQWPTMLVPCDMNEVRNFFLQKARELLDKAKA